MKIHTITLFVILTAFSNIFAQDFWEKTTGLDNDTIYSLAINSNGHIIAGTASNGVFRSTDNGENWLNLGLDTFKKIKSIVINSNQDILVGTEDYVFDGGIYRSTDNGNTWNIFGIPEHPVYTIAVNSNEDIFVGTPAVGIYRSTDNGNTWLQINQGLTNLNINTLLINSSDHIFAGTINEGIFRSTDNGENWIQTNQGLTSNNVTSFTINLAGHILAGTIGQGVFRSNDNGQNWVQINSGLTSEGSYVTSLAMNSNGNIYTGSFDGVFQSTNNGDNWIPINQGITNIKVRSLAINLTDDIFAGTEEGLFRTIPSTNIKVFLQGPYLSGSMSTTLRDNGYVPLVQPYNVAPFNYSGSESVDSIPAGIVDWVLLELRSDSVTQVSRRAAFLKSDGSLVDLDGVSNVKFPTVSPGDYYVVITHRNHLPIMTSNPVELSYSPVLYDFTTGVTNAFGTNAMKNLDAGVYGMYSGDTNNSGIVTAADKSLVNSLNLSAGYYNADTNFSGIVTAADKININSNNLKQEFVP